MKIVLGPARSRTRSPGAAFHVVALRWQRQVARLFDPYRPECHYMRGPGPKCRAKRDPPDCAL